MPPALRLALMIAAPLALAACGDAADKGDDRRTAAGEILPGSISDDMLPYDTVRSEPPLATPAADSGSPKGKSAPKGTEAADEAAPTPAESPAEEEAAPSPAATPDE